MMPPLITVGSSPPASSMAATIDVVVVLPCVPPTAIDHLSRISSPSISARRTTGTQARARRQHLGIVLLDRARHDHDLGVGDIVGAMADRDLDAELGQAARVGALGDVAALHLVAEIVQHLGDAGHADAADADEVDQSDIERQRPHAATPDGERARPVISPTRSARRAAASGRPAACAAAAMSARRCGVSNSAARWPARVAAVNVGMRDHDAGARRLEGAGVGASGDRRRRRDRAPGSTAGRWSRARPRSRRRRGRSRDAPPARRCGRSAKNGASSATMPAARIALRARARDPRAGTAGPGAGARAAARGSDRMASGTTWLNDAAPWLPPNTSEIDDAALAGRAIGRAAQRPHRLAHRIADQARAAVVVGDVARAVERRRDPRRAAQHQAIGLAQHGVLLVQHGRQPAQAGGDHGRHRGVAAEADDGRRARCGRAPARHRTGRGRATASPSGAGRSEPVGLAEWM